MNYKYLNITGNTAQELIDDSDINAKNIKLLNVCNVHASDSVNLDLYFYRSSKGSIYSSSPDDHANRENSTAVSESYYIVKNMTIPYGKTLQFEASDFLIDKTINYALYIKLNNSDSAVDIIIKN
mgnify:FL=1